MCNQLELREEDYHKLFNTLIFSFDQLLTIATEKAEFVRFVEIQRFGSSGPLSDFSMDLLVMSRNQ